MRNSKPIKFALRLVGSLITVATLSKPAFSADRVYLSYGILERSISVSSLENYARTGTIDNDLYGYTQYINPTQLQNLRRALLARADLSPIAVAQFLYTPQGEILLRRFGQVIQPESGDTGFYAIRAALILAAADPGGLTPLNVFRKFPTRGIRINLQRSLEITGDLGDLINQTNRVTQRIEELSRAEVTPLPPGTQFADLGARGAFSFQKETLQLVDRSRRFFPAIQRDRVFPVDVYLPRRSGGRNSVPVLVISHGLGSDRTTFQYLAEHLASHGFAVAVPEHPGSNAKQLQALIAGTASEVASPTEFIDRPLDIKFLLDDLTRRAGSDARYAQLNLQSVGVLGQSFGGYTVLALAGAPINFAQLQKDCNAQALDNTLNISLLLQCRAGALPAIRYNLSDSRVKAIIAINPIASSIFGEAGIRDIRIPTMIIAGNADTIAPALPEQIRPFTELQTSDRYLAVIDRGTHFSTLGESQNDVPLPEDVIGPSPSIAQRYTKALSLAFFETYIANDPRYRAYLSPTYAQALSRDPLRLSLVQALTLAQLNR